MTKKIISNYADLLIKVGVNLQKKEKLVISAPVIAADLGRSEKTVDRLMSKMREHGYIQAEEHWTETGAQLANSYTVVSR